MIISISTEERLRGREDSKRYVIFLDIDGVLQPCCSQKRFKHDLNQTRIDIAKDMKDDSYLDLDKYDVGAVYYDWNEMAVNNLHALLRQCDAEIVISSDWKHTKTIAQLKLLFRIHKLDAYITDIVPYSEHKFNKPEEIREYLRMHPELTSYVVIDDLDMEEHFRGHTVYTGKESFLTAESMAKAARILKFGPWWEEKYNKKTSVVLKNTDLIEDGYKKVIFLDIDGVLNDEDPDLDKYGIIISDRFVRNLSQIIRETGAEIVLLIFRSLYNFRLLISYYILPVSCFTSSTAPTASSE